MSERGDDHLGTAPDRTQERSVKVGKVCSPEDVLTGEKDHMRSILLCDLLVLF